MSATSRTRVLTLVDDVGDDAGGAERFAVALTGALPDDRFERWLCATHGIGGALAADLDRAGVGHFALGRSGRFDVLAFRRLVRFLLERGVDVLHAHKFGSNLWGSAIGALCRTPVVVAHEHTWSYEGQPLRKLLDGRLIGRLADAFVAVSSADRERMVRIEGVPAAKALVIPTAFVPRPATGAGGLRDELGIAPEAPVVGTVARLRPQKALEVLVQAFAGLLEREPAAHLVIVGEGEERGRLGEQAGALGIAERVHLPGQRNDLDEVLPTFTVAAMSSDFEGLPLFVFECMAFGIPLVSTDVGGLRDVVRDGETGLLVPARDPDALTEALVRVLRDHALAQGLAEAAAARLPEFSLEAAAERFASLYEDLLAGAQPRCATTTA